MSHTSLIAGVCSTDEIQWNRDGDGKIDFYPFHFMFPEGELSHFYISPQYLHCQIPGTQKVNLLVEGQLEIKQFCIDYVQRAEVMFILATVSCTLVVVSLVHFLMALSANYAHISRVMLISQMASYNLLPLVFLFLLPFCSQKCFCFQVSIDFRHGGSFLTIR